MDIARYVIPALIAAVLIGVAALAASDARAAEPDAVSTAPATAGAPPAGPSVAEQIDNYLKTSPALASPRDRANGVVSGDEPRKIHGVVDVAVGSNGFRSAFMQSDIPVGKTATVSIAVGETRFDGRLREYGEYGGAGGSRGLGFGLGGGALDPRDLRCRQIGEERSDPRLGQRFEGERPRACRTAGAPAPPR